MTIGLLATIHRVALKGGIWQAAKKAVAGLGLG